MEPVRIMYWEGLGLLGLIAGSVVYAVPRRWTWWRGMLTAPGQVQLLVVTVLVCARFVAGLAMDRSGAMPGIGTGWLVLFGVSGVVYGAMKGFKMLRVR